MSKYVCKNCGKEISENMKFCKYCGNHLIKVRSVCPTCHSVYDESTNFCPTCATRCDKKEMFDGKDIESGVVVNNASPKPMVQNLPKNLKSVCPTCHRVYDESTNFCPVCASRCEKKEMPITSNQVSNPVKPVVVPKPQVVAPKPSVFKYNNAFSLVDNALENKLIKKIFSIYGIVNVCIVSLTILVLMFAPIFKPGRSELDLFNYTTLFSFVFKNIISFFKAINSGASIIFSCLYNIILLTTIISFVICELVRSVKLIKGDYRTIFLNDFSKNINSINTKIFVLFTLITFVEYYKDLYYYGFVLFSINPVYFILPSIITSIGYVIVGMVFKHIMIQKSEPKLKAGKMLLTHRIMHLVCSFMTMLCFFGYMYMMYAISSESNRIGQVDTINFWHKLIIAVCGILIASESNYIPFFLTYFTLFTLYNLFVIPFVQLIVGTFRVIGFNRANEMNNKMYKNAGMGRNFGLFTALVCTFGVITLGNSKLYEANIIYILLFSFLFFMMLGLTIAIIVIEKKAKRELEPTK